MVTSKKWSREEDFHYMQRYLLFHKYLYYEKSSAIITDYHFDSAERYTKKLAKELGIKLTDLDPCNMVGFNDKSPYWEDCKKEYSRFLT